ncbi:MAG: hypothetical protein ACFE0I_04400 [Elainellaceae cyanobacterium]
MTDPDLRIPQDHAQDILAIALIYDKLPFLVGLTQAERKRLCRMGDKTRPFVNKSIELAAQNHELMSRCLDIDEMRRDVDLVDALYPIMLSVAKLQELLEDTYLQAGSEAFEAARMAYSAARKHGKNAGIDSAVEEVGRRFSRKRHKPKAETTSAE